MLNTIFATKGMMSQAWTRQGKRLPITKCKVDQNVVLGTQKCFVKVWQDSTFKNQLSLILEIGYGKKKLKNTPKPLRTIIEQSGFSFGFKQIRGVKVELNETDTDQEPPFKIGQVFTADQVLQVGDIVKVQGTSKGKGFAGVVKRHGMAGGPKTRGQSDRERAVGSIGASADWGRVFKGKRMPGHLGDETVTVTNLTVVHIDEENNEVWLSGPVPGHTNGIIRITKTGDSKSIELNPLASGIEVKKEEPTENTEVKAEVKTENLKVNSK
jgi:large subunit ribosomal protein L3